MQCNDDKEFIKFVKLKRLGKELLNCTLQKKGLGLNFSLAATSTCYCSAGGGARRYGGRKVLWRVPDGFITREAGLIECLGWR